MLCICPVQQIQPRNVASLATLIGPTATGLKFGFKANKIGIFQSQRLLSFDRLNLAMAASSFPSQDPFPGPFSPAQRIGELYKCINKKNLKGVEKIVSEDCCIEDFSFPKPFQGKKVSLLFLHNTLFTNP